MKAHNRSILKRNKYSPIDLSKYSLLDLMYFFSKNMYLKILRRVFDAF